MCQSWFFRCFIWDSKSSLEKVTVLSAALCYDLNTAQNGRYNFHSCYYSCEVYFFSPLLRMLSFFPFLRPSRASQESTFCNCCKCCNFWCCKNNIQGKRPKLAKMCQVSGLLIKWWKFLLPSSQITNGSWNQALIYIFIHLFAPLYLHASLQKEGKNLLLVLPG